MKKIEVKIFNLSILLIIFIILKGLGYGFDRPSGPGMVVGLEGNPTSLDPRFATDAYSERILPLIYSSLLYLDEKLTLSKDLAVEWNKPDEKTHVFRIKKG
jgi:peptide/nickel transport system substrate-binding protein